MPEAPRSVDDAQLVRASLARSTTTGFLWLLLQGVSGRAASFISQLVLARLLLPQQFGQIGLAYTVTTLVGAIISFGVDDILLQRLHRFQLWATPAFWSSLALSLIGMTLMLGGAPFAAEAYHSPGLVGLVAVLAITLPLNALATVPAVKLRADMNFRYLGTYASAETLLIQVASVVLAAFGFGAYSFVLPLPIASAIKLVVFWRKAPSALRSRYRGKQYRHIVGSGLLVLAARLVNEAVNQGDYIVLGLMTNDAVVGVYYFAFRLAAQPVRMLAGSFGSVLFPAFTQLKADPRRQELTAIRAARILAYIVTPACYLQAAVSAPVLHLMFGSRWNAAIPLVQVLSLGLPGDAVAWVSGALLIARREFLRDFNYLLIFAIPFFGCVIAGAWLASSLGVAAGVSLYYAFVKPLNSWLVFRDGMSGRTFVQVYLAPPGISAVAIGAAYEIALRFHEPILQLVIMSTVGLIFYVVSVRLFVPDVLKEILDRFPVDAFLWRVGRTFTRKNT